MATSTYTAIASITLGSNASSVEFSSIPQDYRDLVLVTNAKYTSTSRTTLEVNLNSDTGSNYSYVGAGGGQGTPVSFTTSGATRAYSLISSVLGTDIFEFMDYSATDKHKTLLLRINNLGPSAPESLSMLAERWANTSAITTIKLQPANNLIAAGSTFALYGIEA